MMMCPSVTLPTSADHCQMFLESCGILTGAQERAEVL